MIAVLVVNHTMFSETKVFYLLDRGTQAKHFLKSSEEAYGTSSQTFVWKTPGLNERTAKENVKNAMIG